MSLFFVFFSFMRGMCVSLLAGLCIFGFSLIFFYFLYERSQIIETKIKKPKKQKKYLSHQMYNTTCIMQQQQQPYLNHLRATPSSQMLP